VIVEQALGAVFTLLELAQPAWLAWHHFTRRNVAAGTRIVIHGRSRGAAPGAVQPSLVLPAAPPGTRGHPRLRAPMALRLVDRDRRPVHVYDHRPVSDYTPMPAHLLRKFDDTSFLIFEAHPLMARPEQRLELRYRRGDAPALTEHGVDEPEIAVLRCRA
jgi:hypothetical protein